MLIYSQCVSPFLPIFVSTFHLLQPITSMNKKEKEDDDDDDVEKIARENKLFMLICVKNA